VVVLLLSLVILASFAVLAAMPYSAPCRSGAH
jgi:hypothetical protein